MKKMGALVLGLMAFAPAAMAQDKVETSMGADIVSWSYLQATGTELDIYVCILDNRNLAVYERHDYVLALQPGILLILWVDTHGRVTHDGLRTGGCYYSIVSLLILVYHVLFMVVAYLSV